MKKKDSSQKDIEMKLLGNSKENEDQPAISQTSKPPVFPPVPFPESLFAKPRPIPEKRVIYLDGTVYPPNLS